ncbi:glutamine synthetase family protein [Pseudemcibacter aquimaris]|uniref:glutamine synthetase family protein n=1 Tax=Pseudemcibacter aquimaris TaxID=2857064 RepID=UPI002012209D|nr:glutamine synthetase family protein [Pseudemcibacter aquimaris]MCC3862104.1 glutamine synthetase family protein [Pseudemcibacter aquimaris]WDU58857.1 glutamine synthetase family protein [Pseudemcibacter aquimaris]
MEKASNIDNFKTWLSDNDVVEVEIVVCDFAGIARGKLIPVEKFIGSLGGRDLRMPDSIFSTTVDGQFALNEYLDDLESDLYLIPEYETLRMTPWRKKKTASVICSLIDDDGENAKMDPRQILKNVLNLYKEKGWQPIVAPEFEFHLIAQQGDSLDDPSTASGKTGKPIGDKAMFSMDSLDEFEGLFSDVREYSAIMGVPIDTIEKEAGAGQFEINMQHGDPLDVADQAFHFKRILKQSANNHGATATMAAKPFPSDYGNSMHIHQSVVGADDGKNIFADDDGNNTEIFENYVAGIQKYVPNLMPIFAPYSNSYLRFGSALSSPANLHWGVENRSVGLRVPAGSSRAARRVENRIAGSDVNPYLVFAASLMAGYLGIEQGLKPSEAVDDSAYEIKTLLLPTNIYEALNDFDKSKMIRKYLGDEFVTTFKGVKQLECQANESKLTEWEIRYLLANV